MLARGVSTAWAPLEKVPAADTRVSAHAAVDASTIAVLTFDSCAHNRTALACALLQVFFKPCYIHPCVRRDLVVDKES